MVYQWIIGIYGRARLKNDFASPEEVWSYSGQSPHFNDLKHFLHLYRIHDKRVEISNSPSSLTVPGGHCSGSSSEAADILISLLGLIEVRTTNFWFQQLTLGEAMGGGSSTSCTHPYQIENPISLVLHFITSKIPILMF